MSRAIIFLIIIALIIAITIFPISGIGARLKNDYFKTKELIDNKVKPK